MGPDQVVAHVLTQVHARNHATGCPFQSRSSAYANRPMKRPLNGLQIGIVVAEG